MADYSLDINTELYKYIQQVYVTEPTGVRQTYIPLKLNLNVGNFNFDLARSDGLDFHLAERSNGTGVLQMWVAYWNASIKKATVWFKLPELLASETRTLYAIWGYESDSGISNVDNLATGIERIYSDSLITASGTASGYSTAGSAGGTFPANCFDNNPNTYWWATCVAHGDLIWLQWDFGAGSSEKIERINMEQYDIKTLTVRGSNDGVIFTDIFSRDFPDMPGGSVPEIADWFDFIFDNDTYYQIYRLDMIPWTDTTIITEVQMMSVILEVEIEGVFLFVDDFDGYSLDIDRWASSVGSWVVSDSRISLGTDAYIQCNLFKPLAGVRNWIVEEGLVGIGSPSSTTVAAHRYRFYGGENVLGIDYYWDGGTDRRHDVATAGTFASYNGTNRGLEIGSYSQNYFGYYEPTDNVYQGMANRASYSDYDDNWERQVHRNTELTNFKIQGEDTSAANGVSIDWVVVREFTPDSDPLVDYRDLWVDYEYVVHQPLDYTEYTSDVTSVDFYHLSDMGGDPYRMSDNVTNSISNIFISDDATTEGSITIDFGRQRYSVTDKNYIHFSSDNSVEFYNASKLSDLDDDVYDRDYWQTTTTSGWAAIEFTDTKDISCLAFRAVPGQTNRMPKNFKFYGSQSNPRFDGWNDKVLIYEGAAVESEVEQTFYFSTGLTFYKYYILEVLDTHGGNIAIQEWGMYERHDTLGKKTISQLRLHPVAFTDNEYYFPKQIEFYGSNDGFVWDTLLFLTDTPTPFTDYAYGRWSRYSFENFKTYYIYKLTCYDDWHPDANQIKIAEWEMVESIEETNNYRILSGSSNIINNIWADPDTTISSGTMYITNEAFNTVEYEKLVEYITVSGIVGDFNVKL